MSRPLSLLLLTCLWTATGCTTSSSGGKTAEQEPAKRATAVNPEKSDPGQAEKPETRNEGVEGPPLNETFNVALLKKKRVPAPRGEDDVLEDISTRRGGSDWPSFLGPNRNSSSPEKGIITDWSEGKLKILWQAELGTSYGIGSVSKGRYFQFDQVDEVTLVNCHNAETGKLLWQFD